MEIFGCAFLCEVCGYSGLAQDQHCVTHSLIFSTSIWLEKSVLLRKHHQMLSMFRGNQVRRSSQRDPNQLSSMLEMAPCWGSVSEKFPKVFHILCWALQVDSHSHNLKCNEVDEVKYTLSIMLEAFLDTQMHDVVLQLAKGNLSWRKAL